MKAWTWLRHWYHRSTCDTCLRRRLCGVEWVLRQDIRRARQPKNKAAA